ncbi:hypothetical protein G6F64_011715 [Rhizopus arrhizus]|uniref:Reverse transcriptase domain-containing protein n=1 Tax=Rhizopus oryzae TaxID=64495 RepID=A0A9P6WYW4_RHIOR|nr:hypothetical protein G6F64_011715 [Rhizopus arrhizus]
MTHNDMTNTSTPKHVAPSLGSKDSLPHPIPGGDIHSVPDSDDLLFYFQETKRLYGEISEYVQSGRAVFLQRADDLLVRVVSLDASLGLVDPRAAVTLAQMRGEADAERQGYIKEVEIRDGQVEPCKEWCRTRLNWMMQQNKPATMTLVKDMEWPTFSVCQDLGLNPDFFQALLPTGDIQAMDDIQDDKDATIRELRKMIHELQQERILWRQQLQQDTKMSKDTPVKVMKVESGDSFNNMQETYKERRRRTRIPVFEKGSMDEAQKWLNRYESLAGYLGFHGQDKIDELNAVLMGQALNWFEGLGADEKKSWETVKSMFLHQFGGGANPALAALDQLKNAKQGSKETIGEFAPKLKDLLYRAQVFSPAIQLDYFKDKIKPELKTAVIFARARNLEEGINIATEIERELLRKNQVPDVSSLIPEVKSTINYGASSSGSSSNLTTGEIQNYQQRNGKKGRQENRSCHYCKKVGHLKKNCRKRLRDLQEQHGKTQHNNHQDVKNTEEEDEEFDIFEQFVNQQDGIQEVVVQAEKNPRRFHYVVKQADGQGQQVLVDTGSTISTITRKKCVDLGLLTCQGPVTKINYGNASQQYTTTKAVWLFKLGNQPTMAHLHVVEKQNEDIILGMDWMVYEDIWLHPKSKAILKIKQEGVNNMEEVVKKNFPSLLVDDSGQQTITNATYRHQIDTGDSQPVARRDYRRSEVEKKAIEEEVQKMLKSGVIVPSNSDWCSPVVLIKKPDGSFRFCVDYRGLNKVTKKDKYPLPRIDELLDKLHGAKYFSTIDLKSGYWQLPLDPKDAKKTAFIANGSLYEFTVMPFGVVNGPASFMRFMNNVLRGLPQTMIYLDDIICYHATYQEHKKGLQEVLQRLVKYNLKISITKCQFFQKEVKFLGFLVSGQGIRSDPVVSTQLVK